jgi:hypothetical protein
MGCDDVPDNLFPRVRRDPTMADIEALEERVAELERLIGILRDSPWSPPSVRAALSGEHLH